jgi:hypothetical protein
MASCNSSITISVISGFCDEAEFFNLLGVEWSILVFGYQIPNFTVQHPRRAKTLSYGSLWTVNLKQKTNSATGGYVQCIIKF